MSRLDPSHCSPESAKIASLAKVVVATGMRQHMTARDSSDGRSLQTL